MENRMKYTRSERMLIREGIVTEGWMDKLKKAGKAGAKAVSLVKKFSGLLKTEDPIDIALTLLSLIPGDGEKIGKAREKIKETIEALKPFLGPLMKEKDLKKAIAALKWEDVRPILEESGHADVLKQLKGFVVKHGDKMITIAGIIKDNDMEGLEKFIGFSIPTGKDKVAEILEKISGKIGDKAGKVKKIIDVISAFPLEKPEAGAAKSGGEEAEAGGEEQKLAASYILRGPPLFESSILPYAISETELNEAFRRVGEGLVAATR